MAQILTVPHPLLRQVANPVEKLDKRVLNVVKDMALTLKAAKNPEGVGLAACQIGAPLRIFLIRLPGKNIQLFINPEISKFSPRLQSPTSKSGVYEGCLSLPHYYAPIKRSQSVTVRYQTLAAQSGQSERAQRSPAGWRGSSSTRDWPDKPLLIEKTTTFSGLAAQVIQHEMDHLNGILFIDRVLEQNAKLYRAQGKKWEEVIL